MAEMTYKYVVLKNRAGEYLIPYCGMPDFADVAISGSWNDLKDKPEIPDVKAYAKETEVVHLAGAETITGTKSFSGTVNLGANATATTKEAGTNSTAVATTAFVATANSNHETAVINAISSLCTTLDNETAKTPMDA